MSKLNWKEARWESQRELGYSSLHASDRFCAEKSFYQSQGLNPRPTAELLHSNSPKWNKLWEILEKDSWRWPPWCRRSRWRAAPAFLRIRRTWWRHEIECWSRSTRFYLFVACTFGAFLELLKFWRYAFGSTIVPIRRACVLLPGASI